jgi:hypothetical protein
MCHGFHSSACCRLAGERQEAGMCFKRLMQKTAQEVMKIDYNADYGEDCFEVILFETAVLFHVQQ